MTVVRCGLHVGCFESWGYVSSSVSWIGLLISMVLVPVMICVSVGCACAPSVRTGWFL